MSNINQEFWTQLNSIIPVIVTSLLIIFSNWFIEKSRRTTQIKLEKLKLYDEKKFQAYLGLNEFISKAYHYYWPPDNVRQDFINVMKVHFFIKVRVNYPYFRKDIREIIKILENQYECLSEPDFIPNIPMDQFLRTEYLNILNELSITVERIFDDWEKN